MKIVQLIKKLYAFYDTWLTCSHKPAAVSYPKADDWSPQRHAVLLQDPF
jgi:hypothetical protein